MNWEICPDTYWRWPGNLQAFNYIICIIHIEEFWQWPKHVYANPNIGTIDHICWNSIPILVFLLRFPIPCSMYFGVVMKLWLHIFTSFSSFKNNSWRVNAHVHFFVSNSQECSWWNCLSTNVCCKYICLKKQELVAQLLVFTASAPKWNARLLCYHVLKHTFLLGWVGGSKKHNMFILFCWKTYCSPTSSS